MILDDPKKFPNIDPMEPLICDVETTSFDDEQPAFKPFSGHRIAGYAFGTLDGKDAWYLPVRHSGESADHNCPLKPALAFAKDILESGRTIVNHNIKFDARFWHQDGIKVVGPMHDTLTLARLVDNQRNSYTLDSLSGSAKLDLPKQYCKEKKTKDYGKVPIPIMAPYAATHERSDVRLTAKLYRDLLKELPDISKPVWENEIKFTKVLLESEIHGIRVDKERIQKTYYKVLKEIVRINEELIKISGNPDFEPGRQVDVNWLLIEKLGFTASNFTPTGRPKWDNITLANLKHPAADMLREYTHLVHFSSTYCEGWLERLGDDGRLHPDFKQSGTRTGRLSSGNPNMQNCPVEAEAFVIPDEGCVIVGADYSQIEYRVFAHYANDSHILKSYKEDPDTDYHSTLAKMMGVDRQFSKSLNFAFLYGMGKKKLIKLIAAICATKGEDTQRKLNDLTSTSSKVAVTRLEGMPDLERYVLIAETLYDQYHRTVPTIRQLTRRVTNVIMCRGWIKNYMGRVYRFTPDKGYMGVNYLIQGSCADIFKERLVAMAYELPQGKLFTNVHDSGFYNILIEEAEEFYIKAKEVLENVKGLRVPISVEGKVSAKDWSTTVAIDKDVDFSFKKALEKSKTKETAGFGSDAAKVVTHGRMSV